MSKYLFHTVVDEELEKKNGQVVTIERVIDDNDPFVTYLVKNEQNETFEALFEELEEVQG